MTGSHVAYTKRFLQKGEAEKDPDRGKGVLGDGKTERRQTGEYEVFVPGGQCACRQMEMEERAGGETENENDRTWTLTAKRETGKCSNRLDASGGKEKDREAKEDMETNSQGRPERDGSQLAWGKKGR
ncbi:Hypothetical predicted protein [Xyrichtys novacula]|uniref:Uncharacterized protein n=1 Tax=Xyrichtys novacula TaxID=13765 RepID=A0AAV1G392_XYRNO|nr:Hypothetical predicted protein [Xyrichtys novacula]